MTDTSAEAVERLAREHDLVRFTLGMKSHEHDITAATLRALLARAERAEAARAEAIARMSDMARQAGSWQGIAEGKDIVIRQLEAERDAAREALTGCMEIIRQCEPWDRKKAAEHYEIARAALGEMGHD